MTDANPSPAPHRSSLVELAVDRPVAVKILSSRLVNDPALRERFRREAKNAAALAHPNIIEIYDYGETEEGAVFLVMELLSGTSLQSHVDRGRART